MKRLIMMIGYPGSGKTTYAYKIKGTSDNVVIHSSDAIREELYGTEDMQGDPQKVFSILHRRAIIDLRSGKDVILDATYLNKEDRAQSLYAIKSMASPQETIAVILDTELSNCRKNNLLRERKVPGYVYEKMEALYSSPTFGEGFDQLISVRQQMYDKGQMSSSVDVVPEDPTDIEFIGVFFEHNDFYETVAGHLDDRRIGEEVLFPHVTFQYRPDIIDFDLFGEEVTFEIIGYGNDGINEGVEVQLIACSPAIQKLFCKIAVPHITLSFSEHGAAVNTRYLDFDPITPFRMKGVFGGLTFDQHLIINKPTGKGSDT